VQVRRLADDDADEVDAVVAVLELARLHPADESGDGFYVVAWDDEGAPLGHARLALTDPPEMQDVLVRAEARGRGVARALTEALADEVRARGGDRLRLTVSAGNAAAREVYRRLGFAGTGLPPRRVQGVVHIRTGPIEVDDVLLTLERPV